MPLGLAVVILDEVKLVRRAVLRDAARERRQGTLLEPRDGDPAHRGVTGG